MSANDPDSLCPMWNNLSVSTNVNRHELNVEILFSEAHKNKSFLTGFGYVEVKQAKHCFGAKIV